MTEIRVIGLPYQVQHAVEQMSRLLPVLSVSEPKRCRKTADRGKVRVYVRVGYREEVR